jgi:hypothetical protein
MSPGLSFLFSVTAGLLQVLVTLYILHILSQKNVEVEFLGTLWKRREYLRQYREVTIRYTNKIGWCYYVIYVLDALMLFFFFLMVYLKIKSLD